MYSGASVSELYVYSCNSFIINIDAIFCQFTCKAILYERILKRKKWKFYSNKCVQFTEKSVQNVYVALKRFRKVVSIRNKGISVRYL